jgi:hypothetical protein
MRRNYLKKNVNVGWGPHTNKSNDEHLILSILFKQSINNNKALERYNIQLTLCLCVHEKENNLKSVLKKRGL